MNKRLFLVILLIIPFLLAADGTDAFVAGTGDDEMDADLEELNVKAKARWGEFVIELAAKHGVSEEKIEKWRNEHDLEPADIHMALEVASLSEKEPDEVVAAYEEDPEKGWGELAMEMGIQPGSEEFHQLKARTKENKDKMKENRGQTKKEGKGKGKGKNK